MMATEKRLIDVDAALEKLCEYCIFGCYESCEERCVEYSSISKIPTVDAVEVVHGRWIHVPSSDMMTGKAYKCSECNKMRYGSYMPNYCQCCGAKMDRGVDDGG